MIATILLPGVLIYFMYSFMGEAMMSGFTTSEEYVYSVYAESLPQSVNAVIEQGEMPISFVETDDDGFDPKAEIEEGNLDLYIVFPKDFDSLVASYDSITGAIEGIAAPEVEMYYDSTVASSSEAYSMMTALLDAYEDSMSNKFNINSGEGVYDLASSEDMTGMIFSMLMPLLLIVFMFSACMAVAPESIAGEKERGTIATLLVTPVKRSSIAIGKILSLSIISLLSGLCSFVGVMLSIPKLMGGEEMGMVDANIYTVADYAWILGVILSTILVFVSLISVISAFANSVKEAASFVSPLMIFVVLISLSGMLGIGGSEIYYYFIPVFNSVQCISGVFSLDYSIPNIIVTIISNITVSALLAFLLTKMFNSEKVMFRK